MGVSGLWDVLQPAGKPVPLTRLALDAFAKAGIGQGPDGVDTEISALRIGVDASLWIFHARTVAGGSNPLLRTLMFRTLKLLAHPVVPVFVFDGPNKPLMKRGQKVGGRWGQDWESRQFKLLLTQCGWSWWDAPGEAEAELALLSRQKKIDVVMTDDVDALVFGATVVLRNPSRTLSGHNKIDSGPLFETREDYQVYNLSEIAAPLSAAGAGDSEGETGRVGLDVDQMIFIALCSGGDYHPAGIPGCGPKIAVGLARSGLAKELLHCYRTASPEAFKLYLPAFRDALKKELAENTSGWLPNKRKALAASLPQDFPDLVVLEHYVRPAVSPTGGGWPGFTVQSRFGRGDPRDWARACEKWFEWGYAEEIGRKLRTLAWRGEIIAGAGAKLSTSTAGERTIRRRERSEDARTDSGHLARTMAPFPPPRLIKIHAVRTHRSTDSTPEYRIEYDPSEWTRIALTAIDGSRKAPEYLDPEERAALGMVPLEPSLSEDRAVPSSASDYEPSSGADEASESLSPRKPRQRREVDLTSSDKVWIPKSVIDAAYPDLVDRYQADLRDRELRKTPKKARAPGSSPVKRKPTDAIAEKQRSIMAGWLAGTKPAQALPARKDPPKTPVNRGKNVEIIEIADSPGRTPRQQCATEETALPLAHGSSERGISPCTTNGRIKTAAGESGETSAPEKPARSPSDRNVIVLLDDDAEGAFCEDAATQEEAPEAVEATPPGQRLARARRTASRSASAAPSAPASAASNEAAARPQRQTAAPARTRTRKTAQQSTLSFVQERGARDTQKLSQDVSKASALLDTARPSHDSVSRPDTTINNRAAESTAPIETKLRRQPVKFRLIWETDAEERYEQIVI